MILFGRAKNKPSYGFSFFSVHTYKRPLMARLFDELPVRRLLGCDVALELIHQRDSRAECLADLLNAGAEAIAWILSRFFKSLFISSSLIIKLSPDVADRDPDAHEGQQCEGYPARDFYAG